MKTNKTIAVLVALVAGLVLPMGLFAHGGHGHVMGSVKEVKGDRLQVQTREGKMVEVQLTDKTRYLRGTAEAKAAELTAGTRVVIDTEAKDGQAVALEVRLGEATKAPAAAKAGAKPAPKK